MSGNHVSESASSKSRWVSSSPHQHRLLNRPRSLSSSEELLRSGRVRPRQRDRPRDSREARRDRAGRGERDARGRPGLILDAPRVNFKAYHSSPAVAATASHADLRHQPRRKIERVAGARTSNSARLGSAASPGSSSPVPWSCAPSMISLLQHMKEGARYPRPFVLLKFFASEATSSAPVSEETWDTPARRARYFPSRSPLFSTLVPACSWPAA